MTNSEFWDIMIYPKVFKGEFRDLVYYFGLVSQLGLTIVFSTLAGILIGIFLDKELRTSPFFVIIFTLIGILGGIYSVYKQIRQGGRI